MNATRSLDNLLTIRHFLKVALAASVIIGSQSNAAIFQQPSESSEPQTVNQRQPVRLQQLQLQSPFDQQSNHTTEVKRLTLSARFHLATGSRTGVLILKAQIPKGSYIYSITQKGNPPPSKLSVTDSKQFKIKGEFTADRKPKVIKKDPVFNTRLEKHLQTVQFYVPIELAANVDPQKVQPEIVFSGQVCSDKGTCMPIRNRRILAQFAGYFEQQAKKASSSQNHRR